MDTPKIKDRSAKVARRKSRMPVNGIAMKRLLNERAAKAQATRRCWACGEMEPIQTACAKSVEVRSSDTYEVQS